MGVGVGWGEGWRRQNKGAKRKMDTGWSRLLWDQKHQCVSLTNETQRETGTEGATPTPPAPKRTH